MNREDQEEAMRDVFETRRREFLRDMSIRELAELLPSESLKLFHEEDWEKEELIDVIINNYFDKQVNDEIK
jgi:hypothetical protein